MFQQGGWFALRGTPRTEEQAAVRRGHEASRCTSRREWTVGMWACGFYSEAYAKGGGSEQQRSASPLDLCWRDILECRQELDGDGDLCLVAAERRSGGAIQ